MNNLKYEWHYGSYIILVVYNNKRLIPKIGWYVWSHQSSNNNIRPAYQFVVIGAFHLRFTLVRHGNVTIYSCYHSNHNMN